ncbi:hypothetical protein D3C73_805000 [compost metagenome]
MNIPVCPKCENEAYEEVLTNIAVENTMTNEEIWFTNVPANRCTCCGKNYVHKLVNDKIITICVQYVLKGREVPSIIPYPLSSPAFKYKPYPKGD